MNMQFQFRPDGEFEQFVDQKIPTAPDPMVWLLSHTGGPADQDLPAPDLTQFGSSQAQAQQPSAAPQSEDTAPTSTSGPAQAGQQKRYSPASDPNLSHLIVHFVDEDGCQIFPSQVYSVKPGGFIPYWPPKIKGYEEANRGYGYLGTKTHTFPKGEPVTMEHTIVYQETFSHRLLHGEFGRNVGRGVILAAALFYCALVQVYPQYTPINWVRQLWQPAVEDTWANEAIPEPSIEVPESSNAIGSAAYAFAVADNQTQDSKNPEAEAVATHFLTIKYVDTDGAQIAPSFVGTFSEMEFYEIASPAIAGYTADIAKIHGFIVDCDKEFLVTYSANDASSGGTTTSIASGYGIKDPTKDPSYQYKTPDKMPEKDEIVSPKDPSPYDNFGRGGNDGEIGPDDTSNSGTGNSDRPINDERPVKAEPDPRIPDSGTGNASGVTGPRC